jgi:hypothetical protein
LAVKTAKLRESVRFLTEQFGLVFESFERERERESFSGEIKKMEYGVDR